MPDALSREELAAAFAGALRCEVFIPCDHHCWHYNPKHRDDVCCICDLDSPCDKAAG